MTAIHSRLYQGRVFHHRFIPRKHRFSYSVFWLYLDLNELTLLHKKLWFFSYNKPNILSFYEKDFGRNAEISLRSDAIERFKLAGIDVGTGRICLVCNPRCFGYIFNPIAVYYAFTPTDELAGVIYEVTNTFGDRHSYIIPVTPRQGGNKYFVQQTQKAMHVSPFMKIEGDYNFLLNTPSDILSLRVDHLQADQRVLRACFTGRAQALTDQNLTRVLLKNPMMTGKVMGSIHLEALKLWTKGFPLIKRPPAPVHGTSKGISLVNKRL